MLGLVRWWCGISLSAIVLVCVAGKPVKAQAVVSDGTVNTIVTRTGNTFTIDNGTTSGTNLFHSFQEFSLPTGGAAIFNNATHIQNIFSRVTGGTVSNIDGAIQTNGTANLFLLNPAGMLFGANASLNIGGSFIGTTANSIKFADGVSFSASDTTSNPLLTISAPIGLQMGANPAAIQVQNTGHRLAATSTISPYQPYAAYRGLQIQPYRTLALIGGTIDLNGGIIQSVGGRIELGSVAQSGLVALQANPQGFSTSYAEIANFGTIHLTQRSLVETRSVNSGTISIQGSQVTINGGSIVSSLNVGSQKGGAITVSATERLTLSDALPSLNVLGGIRQDNFAISQGGNINIQTPDLFVQSGAAIFSRNYGAGAGGDITINAAKMQVVGFAESAPDAFSRVGTLTTSAGKGGQLTLNTQALSILNGGFAGSVNFLAGMEGGDVRINADRILVQGMSPAQISSGIGANNLSRSGNSGSLTINTRLLSILESGVVNTSSIGNGNAGNLLVNATESISVDGSAPGASRGSSLSSSVLQPTAIYQKLFGLDSTPSGSSGNVVVKTPSLIVSNGATLSVSNYGIGNAGVMTLEAEKIGVNKALIAALTTSGNGGNIEIKSDLIELRDRSDIVATALGNGNSGNGGNITIDAPILLGVGNSDIVASARQGRGGNIQITAQGIFGLKARPFRTSENDITASSQFGINGTVTINTIGVDPNAGLVELSDRLIDGNQQVVAGCAETQGSSFVISGRGGMPENPITEARNDRHLWADLRDLSTFRKGASTIAQVPIPILVEATDWQRNPVTGNVELTAAQPATSMLSATCAIAR